MKIFDATHDLTEIDTTRLTMYKLRENAALRRNEIQEKNRKKAELQEMFNIILSFGIPTVVLIGLIIWAKCCLK